MHYKYCILHWIPTLLSSHNTFTTDTLNYFYAKVQSPFSSQEEQYTPFINLPFMYVNFTCIFPLPKKKYQLPHYLHKAKKINQFLMEKALLHSEFTVKIFIPSFYFKHVYISWQKLLPFLLLPYKKKCFIWLCTFMCMSCHKVKKSNLNS